MLHYFKNTVVLATGTTLITMVVSVLAAYGFSRYKFTGSKCLIWTILFARVMPRVAVIIPYYIILKELKMINTYRGLILVYLTRRFKSVHPIAFLAASAVVGIVFHFSM